MIEPFERSKKEPEKKVIRTGEKEKEPFVDKIHDGIENKRPKDCVTLSLQEIDKFIKVKGTYQQKSFLWIIDDISIKIIREKMRNTLRTHDSEHVCHTNLTGCGKAYIGGEMFFGEDENIYINYKSDRYGYPSPELWKAAKEYFIEVGYKNLIDISPIIAK